MEHMDTMEDPVGVGVGKEYPWYISHLSGRSGGLLGHILGAMALYIGFFVMMHQIVCQARRISGGQSYAESFIPIRDDAFLRRGGKLAVVFSTLFALFFVRVIKHNPELFLTHFTIAISYAPPGVCAWLEGRGTLPYDTHRKAWAISLWIHDLIWFSHAQMKQIMIDQMLHVYLGYIVVLNALTTMYSVQFPASIFAYLASWGLALLQALWITLTGLYESWIDLSMHDLAAILGLMVMSIFCSFVAVYGICFSIPGSHSVEQPASEEAKEDLARLIPSTNDNDSQDGLLA